MRHKMGCAIFESWGEIAPAMGMIGTLIGLVQMLANMSDLSYWACYGSGIADNYVWRYFS